MIYRNGKAIESFMQNGKMASMIMKAGKIIWQAVRSCFGAGYWRGDKPWIGDEAWKG